MIQPNFDLSITGNANIANLSHPQLKTEYAGGFRKFEPKCSDQLISHSRTNKNRTHDNQQVIGKQVLNYVERVEVDNLAELYYHNIQSYGRPNFGKIKQQQQESVTRLYKNLYAKRKTKQEQSQNQQHASTNVKQKQWKLDSKFQSQPLQYIIKNEIQKLHRKFIVQLTGVCKKKKIEPVSDFRTILGCFILQEWEKINKILAKEKINQQKDVQIFYLWKSFLSTANLNTIQKRCAIKTLNKQNLSKLKDESRYIFCLLNSQIGGQKLNLQELRSQMQKPEQLKVQAKQIIKKFSPNKEYTNPFYIQYKASEKGRKRSEDDEEQQQIYQFKAKAIPKSTYEPPKSQNKPQPRTTQAKPFALTAEHKPLTAEQYYKWQRQFKAQPVPKTTYAPKTAVLMSEQQKKARALLNLQRANYPTTMQNLNHYSSEKQHKIQQLVSKHQKIRPKVEPSQIPNFDHLHAQQIILLEEKKERNKKKTQIQPFRLSMNKPRVMKQQNYFESPVEVQSQKWKQKPTKISKSTKKFDAYINYRKGQEVKKTKIMEQKMSLENQRNEKKKPLVEIIKNRMQDELNSRPQKRSPQENSWPQRIKVDEYKIYRQRPLLMQSTQKGEDYELPWDPIFDF